MALQLVLIGVATAFYFLLKYANSTDIPKIRGIPEIPGLPFIGNLWHLGSCHAKKAQEWSRKYGPVFQVRLGNRRIVFANDYDSIKDLWINQQHALISRPTLYTFHSVVSSSQGFTIGTSPWDDSCKQRRKAAATALNRPAVQSYMPIIDLESSASIKELLLDSSYGEIDINPNPYVQRFALNTSLMLNYGYRIKGNVNDEQLKEIIDVERLISNFRSTSNNWQDYVPILRLFAGTNKEAGDARARRDKYMNGLLDMLRQRIANGTDKPCIAGNILKDPEAMVNEIELKSICLSMVSAGLDTVPGNMIMGTAYLSTPHGQEIQHKAYAAITETYGPDAGWEACLHEEKVPYITALVKEVLRFWSVIPICLPRKSIKEMTWGNTTFPMGTTFYMNAYAGNYDHTHFDRPDEFRPERYLNVSEGAGIPHFGYGAGTRMCVGSHLASRELYTVFLRTILAFEIVPGKRKKDAPILDCLDCNRVMTGLTLDPKDFKIGFRVRDRGRLERWLKESEERTASL